MKCDVLVVGAGAAGCVAALKALEQGLDVVIIEKESSIADSIDTKLDLTESIGIEHIIEELDLPIHDRSNKSKWFSPNFQFDYHSQFYDLYVKRGAESDSFEQQMKHRIIDQGGNILSNVSLKEFKWEGEIVKSVVAKRDNEAVEIQPSFVIGADGVESKVLELSGLRKYDFILGEFHGSGVFGTDFNLPTDVTHVFFDCSFAPGGYVFAARSEIKQCILGVGVDPYVTNKSAKEHFENAIKDKRICSILQGANITKKLYGYGKYGILRKHAVGNILMVGDGGRFPDPLFCYGVRQAIYTGYNAADVCISSLESNLEYEPTNAYEFSVKKLQDDIKLGLFLRKVFWKIDNDDLDTIVKIISDVQDDGLDIDYLFKRNNKILVKHILKNGRGCTKLFIKSLRSLLTKKIRLLIEMYHLHKNFLHRWHH